MDIYRVNQDLIEITDLAEEGGALIRCYSDGRVELYEIPLYGGEEQLVGYYLTIHEALKESDKWA